MKEYEYKGAGLTEKTLESSEVFRGKVFRVHKDKVELPNGNTSYREVVYHRGGVCCAAINDKEELAFVRQYRYAYRSVMTELPAGKLEKGEDPFEAVKREIHEEIGARCSEWREMGKLYPTVGYCAEVIHLYTCRIDTVGALSPDEDEFLEVFYIPIEQAFRMVMAGELPDSKTQVLVLKLAAERGLKL